MVDLQEHITANQQSNLAHHMEKVAPATSQPDLYETPDMDEVLVTISPCGHYLPKVFAQYDKAARS